jgi:penicillin amidase
VGDDYPYFIAADWSPGNRAARIVERLRAMPSASIEDMSSVHADKVSIPSRSFVAQIDCLGELDARASAAVGRLREWDGTMAPDSVAAAIYAVWREQTVQLALAGDPLHQLVEGSTAWIPTILNGASLSTRLRGPLLDLMDAGDESILPQGETWPSLLQKSFSAALDWLDERLGPDMNGWQWSRIHRTGSQHPLSTSFPELSSLLDPPTFGIGGDGDTPQAAGFGGLGAGDFTIIGSAVARYAFDLADWERSAWVVPLGSSGHPGSKHFADQGEAWSQQQLFPMHYAWPIVECAAVTAQRLVPRA